MVLLARYGTAQQVQGLSVTYGDAPSGPAAPSETGRPTRPEGTTPDTSGVALIQKSDQSVQAVQDTALRQMVLWSAVAILVMALLAGLLGWWLAGRALRPVASMTEAARRISEQNLHQRLALTGPNDELHRLADTFDTMLDRLERAFESQRRFVANASHELKTPLAAAPPSRSASRTPSPRASPTSARTCSPPTAKPNNLSTRSCCWHVATAAWTRPRVWTSRPPPGS
ncbi:HAMP domain-containing protein [Streptomyces sp. SAI-208]|nr:HAMP domain-containing protein [Streptomyces sp. SAI-208]